MIVTIGIFMAGVTWGAIGALALAYWHFREEGRA